MDVAGLQNLPVPGVEDRGPYIVFVLLRAQPERADALEARLLRQVGPTRAEPGCVAYNLARDRIDPDRFLFYESYTDLAAFQSHLEMGYNRTLMRELPSYLAEEPDVRFGVTSRGAT